MITKFGDISNYGLDIGLKFKSLAVNKLGNHNSRKEGPIKNMKSINRDDSFGIMKMEYPTNSKHLKSLKKTDEMHLMAIMF